LDKKRLPVGVLIVFTMFLGIVGYLVASSFVRRGLPTFEPSAIAPQPIDSDRIVSDTLTVDARDQSRWSYVDFDHRSVVLPPDTAGWDLAFRRFHVIASGGIADLGAVGFESVMHAPTDGFVPTRLASDTVNPAIDRWYDYSFLSHLLESKHHLYVVRTPEDRYAKFSILSYYCPGFSAGCVTLRFTYPLAPSEKR
jgi:hypothetical protein